MYEPLKLVEPIKKVLYSVHTHGIKSKLFKKIKVEKLKDFSIFVSTYRNEHYMILHKLFNFKRNFVKILMIGMVSIMGFGCTLHRHVSPPPPPPPPVKHPPKPKPKPKPQPRPGKPAVKPTPRPPAPSHNPSQRPSQSAPNRPPSPNEGPRR